MSVRMNLRNFLPLAFIKFISCMACNTTRQVCYGELGCFSNAYPFCDPIFRPIDSLPDSPQEINTKFLLYSYISQEIPQELHRKKFQSIKYSPLSKNFKVKIIIHGFVEDISQTDQWINKMTKKSLQSEPSNVIVVDWTDGTGSYLRAVNNARVVGAQVALLITTLKSLVSTPLSSIELIGRGVGAHVAAYAGQRLNGTLGRITGQSPARLFFSNLPNEVKLDTTDALIVNIMDTDSGLGTTSAEKYNFTPRLG